jgi:hypothetical protein
MPWPAKSPDNLSIAGNHRRRQGPHSVQNRRRLARRGEVVDPKSQGLPKSFEVEDTFSGTRRRATVAWIDGKNLGVRFEREAELVAYRPALAFGRRKA